MTSRAAPTKVISNQLAFCYRVTLKENDQSLLLLGHQRWFPATSAPLIQQIRQRVFILTRVACQLHDNSLVFFHRGLEIMSR